MLIIPFLARNGSPMKVLRIFIAILGGYTLTAGLCDWLEKLHGITGRDAQLLTNMVFFLLYLVILMVLFHGTNHRRVVAGTLIANAVVWAPLLLLIGGEA